MTKFFNISILLTLLVSLSTRAQDTGGIPLANTYPIYSQYLLDGLVINPAYAGTRDALSLSLSARKRMLGFEGESTMSSLSIHSPLKKERVALGVSLSHFTYGVSSHTSVYGFYAFHINTDRGKWSLGIRGGADLITSDYSGITTALPGDRAFMNTEENLVLPNVGAGFYYASPNYFIGAAVPSLFTWKGDTLSSAYSFHIDPGYYDVLFSAGALVSFTNDFRFKPSVFAKYSFTDLLRLDINGSFIFYDFLWLGASYRIGEDALVALLEVQVSQQFRLGYSYDYNMGTVSSFVGGTHEIALRFDFGKKVTASNPRYF